ncbi:hypothetical protein [Haloarcula salina]|uniref:Small CPxCG-related zinc finger protein n=1 Tax=Haloarcula salina TaxID=1429914 RepID=A0AA41KI10_9EURY|nr:hypothetical protein [Haloarcula salina]MBV0901193.1 hypothetical protein [Haloarcula salina]
MIERLRQAVASRQQSHRECRRCGTTVESSAATCPVCDSGDIVQYEL